MATRPTVIDADNLPAVRMGLSTAWKVGMFLISIGVGFGGFAAVVSTISRSGEEVTKQFGELREEATRTNDRLLSLASEMVELRKEMAVRQVEGRLELEQATAKRFAVLEANLESIKQALREQKAP